MSEVLNDNAEGIAVGGKVWSLPPTAPPVGKAKRVFDFVLQRPLVFGIVFFVLISTIMGIFAFSMGQIFGEEDEDFVTAVEQEYGYKEVAFSFNQGKADVTTATNEVETVDVLTYKGATILFENREQLEEKMDKVESGTYSEELYLDR